MLLLLLVGLIIGCCCFMAGCGVVVLWVLVGLRCLVLVDACSLWVCSAGVLCHSVMSLLWLVLLCCSAVAGW